MITGLVMTHQFVFSSELQGELLYWVRMVVGTAMLAWIVYGITAIRNRNMDSSRIDDNGHRHKHLWVSPGC